MSLSKNVRHCRRCISLTRHLAENTSRDGNGSPLTGKVTESLNILEKSKMSMPNQWKFLAQIKDFLNKSGYDKNVQLILNKDWIDFFQKLTYSQIESIRRISSIDSLKSFSGNESGKNDDNESKTSIISHQEKEKKVIQEPKQESKPKQKIELKQQQVQELKQQVKQDLKIKPINPTLMPPRDLKEQIFALPQMLADLIPKLGVKYPTKTFPIPKWKTNMYKNVSKYSILSRTKHVLNSIATAESNTSKFRRIEDLLKHIDEYPDARYHAIKEGGIGILLRMRQKTKDENINESIREALTVLGHSEPLPNRGIRILSIDGGGIRGVLVVEMLKKLEQLTGKRIYELFDYICGVSTGAILSAVIGGEKMKTLDEVSALYKDLSTRIFTQGTLKGTSSLVWSHAYYDTQLWEEMLQEQLGDKELIKTSREPNTPKFSIVSAVVNHQRVMAYVFRNYTLPQGVESQYMGSYKYKLWEAVRASAAAPTYFEEYKQGDFLHQDGGILVNNPCAVAIHEAKQLWPNNPIQCVVSFGTGRTPLFLNPSDFEDTEVRTSSWKDKFYKILDSATDTEAVHIMLNDLLPDYVYYRFNPYLTEMLTMVEIREDKIEQMEQDVAMYIRRNEEKFQHVARTLLEKKPVHQKVGDWMRMQKKLFTT